MLNYIQEKEKQGKAESEKAERACLRVVATSPLPSGTSPADRAATTFGRSLVMHFVGMAVASAPVLTTVSCALRTGR